MTALGYEMIDEWRYHAVRIRAILSIAADLAWPRPGRAEDWGLLATGMAPDKRHGVESYGDPDSPFILRRNPYWVSHQRFSNSVLTDHGLALREFASVVQSWINWSGATPYVESQGAYPLELTLGSSDGLPLAVILAAQLVAAIRSPLGIYRCSFCNQPFSRDQLDDSNAVQSRRPKREGNHYCPTCRAGNYRVIRNARARDSYQKANPTPQRRSAFRAVISKTPD